MHEFVPNLTPPNAPAPTRGPKAAPPTPAERACMRLERMSGSRLFGCPPPPMQPPMQVITWTEGLVLLGGFFGGERFVRGGEGQGMRSAAPAPAPPALLFQHVQPSIVAPPFPARSALNHDPPLLMRVRRANPPARAPPPARASPESPLGPSQPHPPFHPLSKPHPPNPHPTPPRVGWDDPPQSRTWAPPPKTWAQPRPPTSTKSNLGPSPRLIESSSFRALAMPLTTAMRTSRPPGGKGGMGRVLGVFSGSFGQGLGGFGGRVSAAALLVRGRSCVACFLRCVATLPVNAPCLLGTTTEASLMP
jgi:hypothetical protein